jgi:hypothetical protein
MIRDLITDIGICLAQAAVVSVIIFVIAVWIV